MQKETKMPCKDCKDRTLGCHSSCQRYLDVCEKRNDEKQVVFVNRMKDSAIKAYYKDVKTKKIKRCGYSW